LLPLFSFHCSFPLLHTIWYTRHWHHLCVEEIVWSITIRW
jgi:hypothetical protein